MQRLSNPVHRVHRLCGHGTDERAEPGAAGRRGDGHGGEAAVLSRRVLSLTPRCAARPVFVPLAYSTGVDDLAAIVVAARAGRREAFATLYRRFHRAVHGVVLARVAYGEAADVVQDVFATALERLPQLAEPAAFPGWLMAIARNRAIDHVRAVRPVEPLDEASTLVGVPAARGAEAAQVLAALRALPEAYRETLVLRLVEGLSGPEIAAQTGLAAGSVRVNLHRGMKLLRERLGITSEEASDVG
jgi:RNA polymerase sigma-70 factor, ECF subfamily